MNREMPSQEEQDAVVWYVLKRPLTRPNTSYKKAAFCIAVFLLANILITALLHYLFKGLGIFFILPAPIYNLYLNHHIIFILLLLLMQFLIGGIIALKSAIIGTIHLYQRYAPEDLRRRCLCKPTCSEYAILSIEKYGVIRGLHKSYIRIFKTCRGRTYMIDEP